MLGQPRTEPRPDVGGHGGDPGHGRRHRVEREVAQGEAGPAPGPVLVTLTATVGGMLPPKPGDLLLVPSPVRCNTILEQKPQSQTCLVINVSC